MRYCIAEGVRGADWLIAASVCARGSAGPAFPGVLSPRGGWPPGAQVPPTCWVGSGSWVGASPEKSSRCVHIMGQGSAGLDSLPGRGWYLRRQFGWRARVMSPPSGGAPGRQCGVHGLRRGAVHEERFPPASVIGRLAVIQAPQGSEPFRRGDFRPRLRFQSPRTLVRGDHRRPALHARPVEGSGAAPLHQGPQGAPLHPAAWPFGRRQCG